ncbi:putative TonB-dependent receptor BfrD precursor [compost metagenome]
MILHCFLVEGGASPACVNTTQTAPFLLSCAWPEDLRSKPSVSVYLAGVRIIAKARAWLATRALARLVNLTLPHRPQHLTLQFNVYKLADKTYYDKSYRKYASVAAARSAVITAHFSY